MIIIIIIIIIIKLAPIPIILLLSMLHVLLIHWPGAPCLTSCFYMCCLPARFRKCKKKKKVFTQYWANPSELLKYTRSWCHTLKIIWCSVSTYIWIIIAFNSGKISPDLVIKCHKIIVVQWRVTYCFEATGDSVVHEISLSFFTRKHSHIHLPA